MKLYTQAFLLAGLLFFTHPSWAEEFVVGQSWEQAIPVGYYKITPPKIPPGEEAEKPKPKKKHRKRQRNSHSGLHVDQVPPKKEIPPTLVPQYDKRPDTMPED
jgi:hypothetical protein